MTTASKRSAIILAIVLYLVTLALIPACIVMTEVNKAHATVIRHNDITACRVIKQQTRIHTAGGVSYLVPLRVTKNWVRPGYIAVDRIRYVESPDHPSSIGHPHRVAYCEVAVINGRRTMQVTTRNGAMFDLIRPRYAGGE